MAFEGTYEAHTVPVSSVTRRPLLGFQKFKVGTRVRVGVVDVPATIVGYDGDTYQVSYEDMPTNDKGQPFTVPTSNSELQGQPLHR
ncbi:MAG: hypothetical protein K8L91_06540 [Anaerolineae bacterium]|nr:hypothetical protein [Anaerolineae bacterium]